MNAENYGNQSWPYAVFNKAEVKSMQKVIKDEISH